MSEDTILNNVRKSFVETFHYLVDEIFDIHYSDNLGHVRTNDGNYYWCRITKVNKVAKNSWRLEFES